MTWEEIGKLINSGMDSAIFPIGATEQHGPHLGCGMDAEIADRLCHAVSEITGALLMPLMPFGCSVGHSRRWPGTLSLQPKTMIDVVKELGDWAYASGIRRLFIVNSHVTNYAPLRCALEMLRADYDDMMLAVINSGSLSERVRQRHFSDADDWHANEAETALMLAVSPQMVREENVAQSDDEDRTKQCVFSHPVNRTSKNGVTGKPSLASVEQGEELFQWMVEDLSEIVRRGMQERPPLSFSYDEKIEFV
ncbi:creatininase family protein [Thiohalophilus sp.]|uniref:creatininase family protein n=1 Tax=Thiohalophilus sp. TaxID=3028392 RepID=UPI003976E57A